MAHKQHYRFTLTFISFSTQAITDILSLATPILALSLSASMFEIGLLTTSRGIVYGIFTFVMGHVSERIDRKRMLITAVSINALAAFLASISTTTVHLILLRLFQGMAMAMFWPTVESMIAGMQDSVTESLRRFNMSWGFGQIIGPVLGGALITLLGIRSPFLFVGALSIADILLMIWTVPREKVARQRREELPDKSDRLPMGLLSMIVLLGGSSSIFYTFFPALNVSVGISAFEIGVMLFVFGAVRVLLFYRGAFSKMRIELRIALLSLGLFLVQIGNRPVTYLGVSVYAVGASLTYTYCIERTLIGEGIMRGRRAGMFEGSMGIGSIIGPFLAGMVAERSLTYAFTGTALIDVLFVVVLMITGGRRRVSETEEK